MEINVQINHEIENFWHKINANGDRTIRKRRNSFKEVQVTERKRERKKNVPTIYNLRHYEEHSPLISVLTMLLMVLTLP